VNSCPPVHAGGLSFVLGAGPPRGLEATPDRAVRRTKLGDWPICATCSHVMPVWIGRNETRVLSLMSALEVNSGTRVDRPHSRTSYSKATLSGSFSSNHFSTASGEGLDVLGVANLLAGVDVDRDSHRETTGKRDGILKGRANLQKNKSSRTSCFRRSRCDLRTAGIQTYESQLRFQIP